MRRRLVSLTWLIRDLLAVAGLYAAFAYVGHPGWGGGLAFLLGGSIIAGRISGPYSPGNAGSLPEPWEGQS